MKHITIDYGIDLGTTNSAISRMEYGVPTIIRSDNGMESMPSCVSFKKGGSLCVGYSAYSDLGRSKLRALKKKSGQKSDSCIEFKRYMGSDMTYMNSYVDHKWTPRDMPPALDVEVESEISSHGVTKLLDMTYRWLEAVESKMGVRPIIYTRENIRDKYLAKDSRFNKYQCWIARYQPDGPENEEWRIWQMTENGHVNGYDGPIDIDLFKGDYKSFSNYLKSIASKEISATK